MDNAIKSAIQQFKSYSDTIYTIDQIEFWLSEFTELYVYAKKNWNNGSCFGDLPCSHTLNNEQSKFIDFYNPLKEIVDKHEYEPYCKQELENYQLIKNNPSKLKDWVKRNEQLGATELKLFFHDYLDYSDAPSHLGIYFSNTSEYKVNIDRKCFACTVQFLEIFNKLYWEDKLLQ